MRFRDYSKIRWITIKTKRVGLMKINLKEIVELTKIIIGKEINGGLWEFNFDIDYYWIISSDDLPPICRTLS